MRNFTDYELNSLKIELNKFKTPWFLGLLYKISFKYIILPIFILMLILYISNLTYKNHMIHNSLIILSIISGGYFILLWFATIYEIFNIKYYQKKLNLNDDEWDYLIKIFHIKRK